MVVYKKAVGPFPAIPALDDSWRLTHDDPPPVGQIVDVCWARCRTPESQPEYHCSTGSIRKYSTDRADHGHSWRNKSGSTLVFGPDFWRPMQDGDA